MAPLPKPEVIITHESDLDGLLSGALLQRLAQKLFGTDIPLEAYHYNFWKQRDLRERSAWVADFTFEPRLDKPDWVIIDHHVTETAPKNAQLIHDVNKSAGLLCYELCRQHGISSPALDRLVHLNNVADLFLAGGTWSCAARSWPRDPREPWRRPISSSFAKGCRRARPASHRASADR